MRMTNVVGMLLVWLAVLCSCEDLKEATEEFLEEQTGCTEKDLGKLNEPALPNCSKAVACCKFIKGECGKVDLFNFPKEVVDACDLNESVLAKAIGQYQGIKEDECPEYLTEQACAEGVEKTRENYRKAVDEGVAGNGVEDAPSCKLIVEQTIIPLNEGLGSQAQYLPKACEVGSQVASPEPEP